MNARFFQRIKHRPQLSNGYEICDRSVSQSVIAFCENEGYATLIVRSLNIVDKSNDNATPMPPPPIKESSFSSTMFCCYLHRSLIKAGGNGDMKHLIDMPFRDVIEHLAPNDIFIAHKSEIQFKP